MDNRNFASLLRRAQRLSKEVSAVQAELTAAFEARYGVTYSDVDEDWLIDSLDYGGGAVLTVKIVDKLMAENGHPLREVKDD